MPPQVCSTPGGPLCVTGPLTLCNCHFSLNQAKEGATCLCVANPVFGCGGLNSSFW